MDQGKENAIEKKFLVRDSAVLRLLHGWLCLFRLGWALAIFDLSALKKQFLIFNSTALNFWNSIF